jgi:hypothetical protein
MASPIPELKIELRATIDASLPDRSYDDVGFARIHELIAHLREVNPTPSPYASQEFVASPWRSIYSQFGPRHTAGKPTRHQTTMNLQSFNLFPKVDMFVEDIDQEIRVRDRHYNNIMTVSPLDRSLSADLIVWGRYTMTEEHPQRYTVGFYASELRSAHGASDDEIRQAFGIPADSPMRSDLKPPKLHSDVVYCDEDLRINFGSMSGIYILERLTTAGRSTSFD